jgi:hypothetical protein
VREGLVGFFPQKIFENQGPADMFFGYLRIVKTALLQS